MSDPQKPAIKAYVTKWALTKGIIVVQGWPQDEGALSWKSESGLNQWLKAGEWSADPIEAIGQAEHRRSKKLKSLAKQISKTQTKKFTIDTRHGVPKD